MGDTGLFVQMSKDEEHEARDVWFGILTTHRVLHALKTQADNVRVPRHALACDTLSTRYF